jgi:class 3 adenylate cyclase
MANFLPFRFEALLRRLAARSLPRLDSSFAAVAPRLFDASIAELKRKPPENWDSYDHVLRGSALVVQFSESSIAEAEAEFRKAIELDPSFGLAYARAAQCTFVRRNIMRLPVSEADVASMLDYSTRRLAAILAADVAGYSRLMAADEVGTLEALKACRRDVVDPAIAIHRGRIVKTTGDGMLVEFASAVDAVTCAMAVQSQMAERPGEPKITFRIGINVGDIIIDGGDIFGDGVNVAARVEGECQPGGVCISANAMEQVRNKTQFAFDDLGERTLKNIDRPVRIFALRTAKTTRAAPLIPEPGKPPLSDKPSIAVLPFQNMSGDPEQEYCRRDSGRYHHRAEPLQGALRNRA